MTTSEAIRHHLHQTLDRVLGPADAVALMGYLPPVDWADIATKEHVAAQTRLLEVRIDGLDRRMDLLDHRMDLLDHRMDLLDRRMDHLDGQVSGLSVEMRELRSEIRRWLQQALFAVISVLVAMTFLFAGLAH